MVKVATRKKPAAVRTGGEKKKAGVRVLAAGQVGRAVERMGAAAGTDRYAAGKALITTAEKVPGRVYPYFAAIAGLLGSDAKIVRWQAQRIVAELASVDAENRIEPLLGEYLGLISGANMISAANAIVGAGKIAAARPELRERIVRALLGVERAEYETPECRNVAIGHALEVLMGVWGKVKGDEAVRGFVERQVGNLRGAVARRARGLVAR